MADAVDELLDGLWYRHRPAAVGAAAAIDDRRSALNRARRELERGGDMTTFPDEEHGDERHAPSHRPTPTDGDRLLNEARTLVGDWNLGIASDARFVRPPEWTAKDEELARAIAEMCRTECTALAGRIIDEMRR